MTLRWGAQSVTEIKLTPGERVEGTYQASTGGMKTFAAQDPSGKTLWDLGGIRAANFRFTADIPGTYLLVFIVKSDTGGEFSLNV